MSGGVELPGSGLRIWALELWVGLCVPPTAAQLKTLSPTPPPALIPSPFFNGSSSPTH